MKAERRYGPKSAEDLLAILRPGLPWLSRESGRAYWGVTGDAAIRNGAFSLGTQGVRMRILGERRIRRRPDANFGWRLDAGIGGAFLHEALSPPSPRLLDAAALDERAMEGWVDWLSTLYPSAPRQMKRLICQSDFVELSITYIGSAAIYLDKRASPRRR